MTGRSRKADLRRRVRATEVAVDLLATFLCNRKAQETLYQMANTTADQVMCSAMLNTRRSLQPLPLLPMISSSSDNRAQQFIQTLSANSVRVLAGAYQANSSEDR